MELTQEQYEKIETNLPKQSGNVSMTNPQFLNAYYAGVGIDYLVVGGAKCSLEWIIAAQEKKLPITKKNPKKKLIF